MPPHPMAHDRADLSLDARYEQRVVCVAALWAALLCLSVAAELRARF